VTLDRDTGAWERAQQANQERVRQARWPMDQQFNAEWRDYSGRVRREADTALTELEALTPEEDRPVLRALLEEVKRCLDEPRLTAQFFSKLASLRDQAAIFA
jgi:hypothetical protein